VYIGTASSLLTVDISNITSPTLVKPYRMYQSLGGLTVYQNGSMSLNMIYAFRNVFGTISIVDLNYTPNITNATSTTEVPFTTGASSPSHSQVELDIVLDIDILFTV
jgi:hypothetical protein